MAYLVGLGLAFMHPAQPARARPPQGQSGLAWGPCSSARANTSGKGVRGQCLPPRTPPSLSLPWPRHHPVQRVQGHPTAFHCED